MCYRRFTQKKPTLKVGFNYFYSLFRTKDFVTGIAEARNNVSVLVQSLVNRCSIQFDVRVRFFQRSDTFWCSYQHQNFDAAAARFFQQVDGRDNGTTVASIGSTISAIRSSMLETSFWKYGTAPAFLHYGTYRRR